MSIKLVFRRPLTQLEISRPGLLILCFAAVYLLWGSTYLAIRWAVADIPPFLMIGLRCATGAVILFLWLAWRGVPGRPSRDDLRTAAVAGALMFAGCHGLLAWAEQRVASGTASLYLSAIPVWLVTLSCVRDRRVPTRRLAVGLILGIVGVAILTAGEGTESSSGVLDHLALVGSGLAWALGSLVALHGSGPASMVHSIALQLSMGAVAVLPISAVLGEWNAWAPAAVSARAWASLAFLVVGGTVLGLAAYSTLLRLVTPGAAGSYAFVNPLVALGLAWGVGDQTVTLRMLVAASIILLAVALTMERQAKSATLEESQKVLVTCDVPE